MHCQYWTGDEFMAKPLDIRCPECGRNGGHMVEGKTETEYLTSIPNADYPGLLPTYRVRTKRCVECDKLFGTVEMPEKYFNAYVLEIARLKGIEKSRAEDKLQIEALTNKLKMIAEITNDI